MSLCSDLEELEGRDDPPEGGITVSVYPLPATVASQFLRSMPDVLQRIGDYIDSTHSEVAQRFFGDYLDDDFSGLDYRPRIDVSTVDSLMREELRQHADEVGLDPVDFDRLDSEISEIVLRLEISISDWLDMEDLSVSTFEDGKKIFERSFEADFSFNIYFFSSWMKKCVNYEQRKEVYESAIASGIRLDVVFLNQWISRSQSFDEIEEVKKILSEYGFLPVEMRGSKVLVNSLKAVLRPGFDGNGQGMKALYESACREEVLINSAAFFLKWMKRASSHGERRFIYQVAAEHDADLYPSFFSEWISGSKDIRKTEEILGYMAERDVYTEGRTFDAIVVAVGRQRLPQIMRAFDRVIRGSGGSERSEWWAELSKCLHDALSGDGEA